MPRLIWVFAGCTCHFVGFVTMQLKWVLNKLKICRILRAPTDKDLRLLQGTAKTDQIGRMPRLINVFTGRTGHFVGFVKRRLKWYYHSQSMLLIFSTLARASATLAAASFAVCLAWPALFKAWKTDENSVQLWVFGDNQGKIFLISP